MPAYLYVCTLNKTRQTKTREQEQQRRLIVVGAAVGALVIGAAVSPWSVVRWAEGWGMRG